MKKICAKCNNELIKAHIKGLEGEIRKRQREGVKMTTFYKQSGNMKKHCLNYLVI